ncbi:MAG: hypothetical protein ACK5NY_00010 [Burkholderiaceae bacterium]|jgi:hypothetical protein
MLSNNDKKFLVTLPAWLACLSVCVLIGCGGGGTNSTSTISDANNTSNVVPSEAPITVAGGQGVALLLPDTLALTDPQVTAWLDAAQEQGYVLTPLRDAEFLALSTAAKQQYSGVILPDGSHLQMSDALVAALKTYATQGGRLMLVFDAGVLDQSGFYAIPKSRFSDIVGLDYALYDELRDRMVGLGPAIGTSSGLRSLQVPPGKSIPYNTVSASNPASFLPTNLTTPNGLSNLNQTAQAATVQAPAVSNVTPVSLSPVSFADTIQSISGYGYGTLTYPSFVTRGTSHGQTLLSSPKHGVIASTRPVGSGSVLFVNLPLTRLKLYDDAMPMHGFLNWFARQQLGLPRLASVPDGIGGLTFNWHLDSNLALDPMQQLKDLGVWNDGPFSMHMTAGPDTIVAGDKIGFDLFNNLKAQQFLKDFDKQGHQIGSHGGWIHDFYGKNVSETNQATFEQYLVLNRNAIQAVIGHPMTEYSAPEGNNPLWTLKWLEENGFKSYYSLSHTGASATRTYRGGKLRNPSLWAFPVVPYGDVGTFEEFEDKRIPAQELITWYTDLVNFSVQTQSSRLIYAHPPGAIVYLPVLQALLKQAAAQRTLGQFRWYTMAQLASFLDKRLQVKWQTAIASEGGLQISATHPTSLAGMAWVLPKAVYQKPVAVSGSIQIVERDADWIVQASSDRALQFKAIKR